MSIDFCLEVCCGSVDDALEAQKGGAKRVELNSSLFFGGLTPSLGAVIEAKKRLNIPVIVMVRPRGGGFCYTDVEFQTMLHDARLALEHGADGIVFGILNPDGTIDIERNTQLTQLAKAQNKEAVFHRAFDVTPKLFVALDQLIEMGIDRILTSGQEPSVPEGIPLLKEVIAKANSRIEILPGGGIRKSNAEFVIEQLGVKMIHVAAFKTVLDNSCQSRPLVRFGGALYPSENQYDITNSDVIDSISEICKCE